VVSEPIETLIPKIMKRYNRHPIGWKVLRDYKGNIIILSPTEGYMLKMITINPKQQTGVGKKIQNSNEIHKITKNSPSYGYRPLTTKQTNKLLNNIKTGNYSHNLINKILNKNPISIPELQKKKAHAVLGGPFIGHPDLASISENQKKLEEKLKYESLKLFNKKYPHRASIYS
jgi:hypothetical protein